MPVSTTFRLNRSGLLLALISTAFAGQAQAAAGRVEFAVGPATVVGADGRTRPASRGTELDTGDVVRTNDGRVQLRMTDGAYISLQPNTEFGIKDYKFEGKTDGSENALYSLVKGAMRTVTGLIGRINRNKYLVSTPTATIGIRGTGGLIQVLNDGSTLVQGTSGIWFLANPAGSIDIPAGVAGIAPVDPKVPPKETLQIPMAGPSPLPLLPLFVQGDQPKLLSGDGYTTTMFFGLSSFFSTGSAEFNASGEMIAFSGTGSAFSISPAGSHANFGTDGILAWGRWIGDVSVQGSTQSYNGNQGLHYVVGLPTASMPTSGTATYALLGATSPTYVDGSAAPGTFGGVLTVSFGGLRSPGVDMALSVGIDGKTYAIAGSASISGSVFSGNPSVTGSLGTCGAACSNASVQGFFAGPNAERAGLGYHIGDSTIKKDIIGAAAFAKQ